MNSVWRTGYYPLPAGQYKILLPDAPHEKSMTHYYRPYARGGSLIYDQVWFPIEFGDNSRFVHVGNLSDGCATVVDLHLWSAVCSALISHRSADGKSVGTLVIKGKPERAR